MITLLDWGQLEEIPLITSRDNSQLKWGASLSQKKYREKSSCYLVEGLRLAEEALLAKVKIRAGWLSPVLLQCPRGEKLALDLWRLGCPLQRLDDQLLAVLSQTVSRQGIVLAAEQAVNDISWLAKGENDLVLILDRLADPGNVGTIIRTAAAAKAGVILTPGCADLYNPKTVRASMGALFRLPLWQAPSKEEAAVFLRESNWKIFLADTKGKNIYNGADLSGPLAWVLGSEAEGADPFWHHEADEIISLPMAASSESLNVAVSAGIILYECRRYW
ncbi:MAG: RNA methyltransferase [Clostridiales bacterium]|nr:RNA methyltransferase [Clostridiales bacterium]